MQTLFLIKDYEDKKTGEKIVVDNNIAHSFIEKGIAVLRLGDKEIEKPVKDKMLRKKKTKKLWTY